MANFRDRAGLTFHHSDERCFARPKLVAPTAIESPIQSLLRGACEIFGPPRGGGRDLHPGTGPGRSRSVRHRPGDRGWPSLRSRAGARALHDPVDLQGARLRDGVAGHGRDPVLERIGVEPSGDSSTRSCSTKADNRPFNPMVNTGAIAATSLVRGRRGRCAAGAHARPVSRAQRPAASRSTRRSTARSAATGHRNRAIAYLELNNGMIDGNIEEHLDLYFRPMLDPDERGRSGFHGATLANGGAHPLTGERALAPEHVRDVLSVMTTCGMYDLPANGSCASACPPRAASAAASWRCCRASSGSACSRRCSTSTATASAGSACARSCRTACTASLDYRGRARSAIRRTYRGTDVQSKRLRSRAEAAARRRARRSRSSNCRATCSSAIPSRRCARSCRGPRRAISS